MFDIRSDSSKNISKIGSNDFEKKSEQMKQRAMSTQIFKDLKQGQRPFSTSINRKIISNI